MSWLASFLLLIAVWALMTLYAFVLFYLVVNAVKFVKALLTTMPGRGYKERFARKLSLSPRKFFSRKRVVRIVAGMALLNAALYGMAYYRWIGNLEAKHLEAKKYLIAGDVLSRQLEALYTVFFPDSYKVRPLVWLLHGIYDLGARHLPDDDAEKALWYYRFFIYPYARSDEVPYSNFVVKEPFRGIIPRFSGRFFQELPPLGALFFYDQDVRYDNDIPSDYREPQIKFLRKSFETLKALSTLPIADPNAYRAYLGAYPGFARYYSLNQSLYYNGRHSRRKLYKTAWYETQDRQQLAWFLAFEKKFDDPAVQRLYGRKLAKNRVMLYTAILNIAEDLIEMSYVKGTFSCDNEPFRTYVRVRNLLIGKVQNLDRLIWSIPELKKENEKLGKEGGVLFELTPREIDIIYDAYISQYAPRAFKYIGTEICGYEVYGKLPGISGFDREERDIKMAYEGLMQTIEEIRRGEY